LPLFDVPTAQSDQNKQEDKREREVFERKLCKENTSDGGRTGYKDNADQQQAFGILNQCMSGCDEHVDQQQQGHHAQAERQNSDPTVAGKIQDVGHIKVDVRVGDKAGEYIGYCQAYHVNEEAKQEKKHGASDVGTSKAGYFQFFTERVEVPRKPGKGDHIQQEPAQVWEEKAGGKLPGVKYASIKVRR